MTSFIAKFTPEQFWPCEEGTILRYRGHTYHHDEKQYEVWMDVIGLPPKDFDKEKNRIIQVAGPDHVIEIPIIKH